MTFRGYKSTGSLTANIAEADNRDVVMEDNATDRTAWLFTRGNASVTMTITADPSGIALIVLGPGDSSATYHFTQRSAVTAFAQAQEQKLIDEGFHLQAVAERRSGRSEQREGAPDRRRPRT